MKKFSGISLKASSRRSDAKLIATLDTMYQAPVQAHDVDTMDRIRPTILCW